MVSLPGRCRQQKPRRRYARVDGGRGRGKIEIRRRQTQELRIGEVAVAVLAAAGAVLERKLLRYKPRHIAFLGKMAYAAIAKNPHLDWGAQSETFAGAPVWVLPNPSGLNRAFQLDALTAAYRQMHVAVIGKMGAK